MSDSWILTVTTLRLKRLELTECGVRSFLSSAASPAGQSVSQSVRSESQLSRGTCSEPHSHRGRNNKQTCSPSLHPTVVRSKSCLFFFFFFPSLTESVIFRLRLMWCSSRSHDLQVSTWVSGCFFFFFFTHVPCGVRCKCVKVCPDSSSPTGFRPGSLETDGDTEQEPTVDSENTQGNFM